MIDDRACQVHFGKFIKEGREQQHSFQSQVAEVLKISQQYYSSIENGVRNVDFVLALKICDTLKLNINDFIDSYLPKEKP